MMLNNEALGILRELWNTYNSAAWSKEERLSLYETLIHGAEALIKEDDEKAAATKDLLARFDAQETPDPTFISGSVFDVARNYALILAERGREAQVRFLVDVEGPERTADMIIE